MLEVVPRSSVRADRRLVNHPCVGSVLSFSLLLRRFINHSESKYSPEGLNLYQAGPYADTNTQTQTQPASLYPYDSLCFERLKPNRFPLIPTLFSDRGSELHVVIRRVGYLQS